MLNQSWETSGPSEPWEAEGPYGGTLISISPGALGPRLERVHHKLYARGLRG